MRALADAVMATASVDRSDAGLEPNSSAVAGWSYDRSQSLSAKCGWQHACSDGGRRAATRTSRCPPRVPRISGTARRQRSELRCDGLAHDHGACFAQGEYACGVATGLPPVVDWRSHLCGHVRRLNDVLYSNRHAVDRGDRIAVSPAICRLRRLLPGVLNVQTHESADFRLTFTDRSEASLKVCARRIGTASKMGCLVIERDHAGAPLTGRVAEGVLDKAGSDQFARRRCADRVRSEGRLKYSCGPSNRGRTFRATVRRRRGAKPALSERCHSGCGGTGGVARLKIGGIPVKAIGILAPRGVQFQVAPPLSSRGNERC